MRPPRLVILALFSVASLFLLCRAVTSLSQSTTTISPPRSAPRSTFRSFFSFNTPFTLFPPNAIITIADDNSTSFAARPAAFGPPLPARGLNGQLWVGGSFAEEIIADGEGDGELGCSDVPGWNDGSSISALKPAIKEVQDKSNSAAGSLQAKKPKQDDLKTPLVDRSALYDSEAKKKNKAVDDGTDDYLHQRLDKSQRLTGDTFASSSNHADIQSIQEGAEIAGKIVLLSRGGCGFLEKVKWAQRRGAIGLIVGDIQRGGPLIQMYAHGDTSNVSIPSIFTSRTTAYLLSLMMQPGSFVEESADDSGKSSQKSQSSGSKSKRSTVTSVSSRDTSSASTARSEGVEQLRESHSTNLESTLSKPGWFSRLLGLSPRKKTLSDSGKSTSASKSDWVLVEDFSDEKDTALKNKLEQAVRSGIKATSNTKSTYQQSTKDDFKIGVEDWRDPDLVGADKSGTSSKTDGKSGSMENQVQKAPGRGSTTPNTGDFSASHLPSKGHDAIGQGKGKSSTTSSVSPGLISKIFGHDQDGIDASEGTDEETSSVIDAPVIGRPGGIGEPPPPSEREGLWVVVTPTSGASPFFDTLLVLVISPLITLTVVYALLLLRARIRRRRWRAPKSVVERLPVRTYHTVTSTPSRTPRLPSPTSSSPTTPLLQSQHGPSRPRPRSRTTTGVPSGDDLLDVNAALVMPVGPREHEKRTGASQWKKYMGRQIECVVCLEEYVDGVSQVMSLPCGHEFHAECITPWLTTRRRTCPICKGDVVRSLARGSSSSPRYEPYHDDSSEDEMLLRAANSASTSSRTDEDSSDLEQGVPAAPHTSQPGWFSALSDSVRDRFFARSDRADESENRDR
ncbi:hypothetical protein F5Y16DRAFT_62684 [Xylariaceae sp. FL0255]|nr:hypothetical protein F5Y16DRAFT_62684 [Xylariaceae sp. FL0255]